jgi:hypothetical protein
VLGQEAAAAFLLERTDKLRQETPDNAAAAQQLAVDLGQLALALEQAGALSFQSPDGRPSRQQSKGYCFS